MPVLSKNKPTKKEFVPKNTNASLRAPLPRKLKKKTKKLEGVGQGMWAVSSGALKWRRDQLQ